VGDAATQAHFETHGWCVFRNAVDPETLAAIQQGFDAAWRDATGGQGVSAALADATGTAQIVGLWARYEAVRRYLFEGGLGQRVASLLGVRAVRLLQDAFLIKPPGARGTLAWHQDYRYVGYLERPVAASVRLALSEETEQNACLWVVGGSHRWGEVAALDAFAPVVTGLDEVLDEEQRAALVRDAHPVPLAPGDISVHHCFTVHRSGANGTTAPRKTLVAHVLDADGRVVEDRLPEHVRGHFHLDAQGRLPDAQFPTLVMPARSL
jgi:phytanoyl-CoA hydroxylase